MPERRRRGRPALREGATTERLSTRLVTEDFDRVCEMARERRMSPAEFLRESVLVRINRRAETPSVSLTPD